AAAALAAVACGGGSKPAQTHLTGAEFAKRANAICAAYSAEVSALGQPANLSQFANQIDRLLPLARRSVARFDALVPPPELVRGKDLYVRQGRRLIRRLEAMRQAARAGDARRVLQLSHQ